VALGLVACVARSRQPVPASGRNAGAVALPVEALVTLQDLMRNEVDASADPIWDSVGTISELCKGSEERQPRTDEQWAAVRQHAVVLLESTNLLVIPERKVSAKPFAADGPGVFDSSQIQDRLDNHRAEFNALALGLRPVAERILAAIDARDPVALLVAGEALDAACEACHRATWYPHEVLPPLPAEPPPPP
jgi:cytochrome c556